MSNARRRFSDRILTAALTAFIATCLLFMAGCGDQQRDGSGNTAAVTANSAPTGKDAFLVFIDQSASIQKFPGGTVKIHQDYMGIAQTYMPDTITAQATTLVEIRLFANDSAVAYNGDVTRIEDLGPVLQNEIDQPIFPESVQRKTLYSKMLGTIDDFCKAHPDRQVICLVLSDGRPDEPFTAITAAATAFQSKSNLKKIVVGPVAFDIAADWRGNLNTSLAPLGSDKVKIVGPDDYQQ